MERHRRHETAQSAVHVSVLLILAVLIAINDPRARHSATLPLPRPASVRIEPNAPSVRSVDPTTPPATAPSSAATTPAAEELMVDPVMPLSVEAITLPWSPLQRYHFLCRGEQRYYPEVTRCRARWQAVLTVYR